MYNQESDPGANAEQGEITNTGFLIPIEVFNELYQEE